ncbi:MAG TPA: hypothetical protein DF637_04905 [Rikenellaceae bacterium]|nr:hypothetical protein [Rikenellaceae bacterium]
MNKIIQELCLVKCLVFPALLAIFISSCVKEEVEAITPNQDGSIAFICESLLPTTKTTLNGLTTNWIAGTDKVGIFSPQASTTSGGAAGVVNTPLTAQSSGERAQFSGTVFWGSGEHNFYSYYPYKEGAPAHTAVPVSLPKDQTQSVGDNLDHLGALDFLVAKPYTAKYPGTSGNGASVSLRYNHLFAILEFQIIRSSGTGAISKVKLTGKVPLGFESGTIDLSQSTPAAGVPYVIDGMTNTSNIVTVSLDAAITPTNDYSTTPKVYMVVLPGTHIGDLKIGVESAGVFKEVKKADVTFDRGKKYIVKVDAAGAEIPVIKGSDLEPVTIGSLIWSPVNLGYSESLPMGELYQWHRKYGYGLSLTTALRANDLWSIDLDQESAMDKYKETFLNNGSDPYDWMPIRHTEWNQSRKFNPCPDGWRVPTKSDYSALLAYGTTTIPTTTGGGVDGALGKWIGPNHDNADLRTSTAIFFPLTGYFTQNSNAGANRTNLGSHAMYWASTTGNTNNKSGDYVQFTSSASAPTSSYTGKCNAYAIRCVKDVAPQSTPLLYTIKPYEVKHDRAKIGGFIEYQGDSPITERGVFWGIAIDPATNKVVAPTAGTGEFLVELTGLEELKTYYARAYAKTSTGTTYYGDQYKFRPVQIPEYNDQEVTINGVTWAPYNAGYSEAYPYGLLYQWHRKFGQVYEGTPATSNPSSVTGVNYYSNKDKFFWYSSDLFKYDCISPQQTSWNMAVEYNPCPVGWRVPTESEMLSLIESGHTWTTSGPNGMKGRWFGGNHSTDHQGSVFLPASGFRDVTSKSSVVRGSVGYYWTSGSTPSSPYYSFYISFSSTNVTSNHNFRGMGYSVRCVKE